MSEWVRALRILGGGRRCSARMGVSARKKTVGDFVHLTFYTVGGEGRGAGDPVFGRGGEVAGLEGREGEDGLED